MVTLKRFWVRGMGFLKRTYVFIFVSFFTTNGYGDPLKEVFMREEMKCLISVLKKVDISKASYLNDDDCVFSLFLSHYEFSFYDCCDIFRRCYIISNSKVYSRATEIRCLKCIRRVLQHIYHERDVVLSICRHHNLSQADLDFLSAFKPLELLKYIEIVMSKNSSMLDSDINKKAFLKSGCILY